MTEPHGDQPTNGEYDETQIRPVSLNKDQEAAADTEFVAIPTPPPYEPPPAYEAPAAQPYQDPFAPGPQYGTPQYGTPQYGTPEYAATQNPAPQYQAPGYAQPGFAPAPMGFGAAGMPPQTAQTSAILATVFGALLTVGCYTTIIGIVPLVFGILGLTKANSVNGLWNMGQFDAARFAADESHKYARWAWISMGIGFAVVLVIVAVIVMIAVANSNA